MTKTNLTKLIKSVTIEKMDEKGVGLVRLADLTAVDHDNDTYQAGAFSWKDGGSQWAHILPAHDRQSISLGKARIYEDGDVAYAELHLNLDSQLGEQWYKALKFDLENGQSIQEWSYGFGVVDAAYEQRGQDRIRVLKRLDVHEVSPVVRGAGVGTRTMMLKSRGPYAEQLDGLIDELDDVLARGISIKQLREAEGRMSLSPSRLDQLLVIKDRLDRLIGEDAPAPEGDNQKDADLAAAEQAAARFHTFEARQRHQRRLKSATAHDRCPKCGDEDHIETSQEGAGRVCGSCGEHWDAA